MRNAVVRCRTPATLAPRPRPAMRVDAPEAESLDGFSAELYVELEMLHLELELVKSLLRQSRQVPEIHPSSLESGPQDPPGSEYWIG